MPGQWIIHPQCTHDSLLVRFLLAGNDDFYEIIAPHPATTIEVCTASPIPPGWVILNQLLDDGNCPELGDRTSMTITPVVAGQGQIDVCDSSPIPANWVVVGEYRTAESDRHPALTCPEDLQMHHTIIQKTIQSVSGSPMQVCADSPLPADYSKQGTVFVEACRRDLGQSLLITKSGAASTSTANVPG